MNDITLNAARIVATILEQADKGCSVCVKELTELAQEKFNQYIWEYIQPDTGTNFIRVSPRHVQDPILAACGVCKIDILRTSYYLRDSYGDYFHAECLK